MTFLRHFFIAIAFVFVLGAGPARAEVKIAVVDLQRALSEVKDGAAANAKLKSAFEEKQRAVQQREQALVKLQDDYEKQSMILSEEARRAKQQEIMLAQNDYQSFYLQSQQEMQVLEQQLVAGLLDNMQEIVAQIAGEKGFTVVLESSNVVYGGGAADITNELIKRYDTKYGG